MHEYDRQTDSGTVTSMPIGEITFQQCRLIIVVDTTKNCLVLDMLSGWGPPFRRAAIPKRRHSKGLSPQKPD